MKVQGLGRDDHRNQLVDGLNTADLNVTRSEQVIEFPSQEPTRADEAGRSWHLRGQHWVMEYSDLVGQRDFDYSGDSKEHLIVLFDDAMSCRLTWGGAESVHAGNTIIVVPPGAVTGSFVGPGRVVRLFTDEAADSFPDVLNASAYLGADVEQQPPRSVLVQPSPAVRAYSLDVPAVPGRFGRIWTTADLMVNLLEPRHGPRDPRTLSPHAHRDFEQSSLVISGEYVHHLRWPWGTDSTCWKDDVHVKVGSPSVSVFPPGVTHTSEATGPELNLIIDIFSPPRSDWRESGWVLNSSDYPLLQAQPSA